MTTSQETSFLSEILQSETIPQGKLAYFRSRLRNRLYGLVMKEFLKQEKAQNLTRTDIARRIGRNPSQITRWFSTPSNWTLDTISDLMIAMGTEPDFFVVRFVDQEVHSLATVPQQPESPKGPLPLEKKFISILGEESEQSNPVDMTTILFSDPKTNEQSQMGTPLKVPWKRNYQNFLPEGDVQTNQSAPSPWV